MFLLALGTFISYVLPAFAGEFDFTIKVEPVKFQCFFQPVLEKHKILEIDYQVLDGGDLNINFLLLLGANKLVSETMKTDSTHRIDVKEAGDYQLCFDNTFSYQARKVIFFEIYLYDEHGNLEEEDISKYAKNDPELAKRLGYLGLTVTQFHDSFLRMKTQLNKIEYYQAMFRSQEARDRSIMNANYDRVLFWSIINSIVLISVGAVQVYMIRSLFEENSKIGRALRR